MNYQYPFSFLILSILVVSPVFADTHNVKAKTLSEIATYPERSAPATVMSLNETIISAELSAQIEQLDIYVGDSVEKGQTIAKLDCRDYSLARREAIARNKALEARIILAEKRLLRAKQLREKQTLAEEILDERESELSVNQADKSALIASIEQARTRESRCNIQAPFSGVVIERHASTGEYATPGTALITIVDTNNTEVSAQLYSADAETLKTQQNIAFRIAEKDYPLTLKHVLPLINSQTRNREIRLTFINEAAIIGTAGSLVWKDKRAHVSAPLLVKRKNQYGVFYVENNKASFQII
ncbi:MAG: efflux RND transporter periplasmic adaptor subunit, partial [Pseudomonadota bacterium]